LCSGLRHSMCPSPSRRKCRPECQSGAVSGLRLPRHHHKLPTARGTSAPHPAVPSAQARGSVSVRPAPAAPGALPAVRSVLPAARVRADLGVCPAAARVAGVVLVSATDVAGTSRPCRGEALPRLGRRPVSPLQSQNPRPGRPCYDKPNIRRHQQAMSAPPARGIMWRAVQDLTHFIGRR